MDLALVVRQRLEQLGFEQRDLATAAQVTESYISQLLTRRKGFPAPDRTDIYDKMGKLLKLPNGELAKPGQSRASGRIEEKTGGPPHAAV